MTRNRLQAALKLGKAIRTLREKKRDAKKRFKSQEELAEIAGFHRTYWGAIERGERNISLENILVIAGTLGLKPSALLREAGL